MAFKQQRSLYNGYIYIYANLTRVLFLVHVAAVFVSFMAKVIKCDISFSKKPCTCTEVKYYQHRNTTSANDILKIY